MPRAGLLEDAGPAVVGRRNDRHDGHEAALCTVTRQGARPSTGLAGQVDRDRDTGIEPMPVELLDPRAAGTAAQMEVELEVVERTD